MCTSHTHTQYGHTLNFWEIKLLILNSVRNNEETKVRVESSESHKIDSALTQKTRSTLWRQFLATQEGGINQPLPDTYKENSLCFMLHTDNCMEDNNNAHCNYMEQNCEFIYFKFMYVEFANVCPHMVWIGRHSLLDCYWHFPDCASPPT